MLHILIVATNSEETKYPLKQLRLRQWRGAKLANTTKQFKLFNL